MYDINKVRADFPILSRTVYDRPLVYLDNAATTQKPLCVLDAMRDEYFNANANVHRGVHYLSQRATDLHEAARETVRKFINAPKIDHLHPRHNREYQSCRFFVLRGIYARGRRGDSVGDGAPLQYRALAVAGRQAWHCAQSDTYGRQRKARYGDL